MSRRTSNFSILVADDNPDDLMVLEDTLEEKGYTVRLATNGNMALQSAKKLPPDLILLDIKMPKLDGYETCQRLKEDPDLKDIPVIFLSGMTETFNKLKAFELGAVAYLTKPFEPSEVLAYVENHLTIARYSKELQEVNEELSRTMEGLEKIVKQNTKEIIESMEKYSTLVEESNDGIVIIQDGVVKFANKRVLDMTEVSEEDVIGKSLLDFVSDQDKVKVMENYKKRMMGEEAPNNYEIMITPIAGGSDLPVEINATTIPFEGRQADMAILRDITERKRAEEELEKYREHLEAMVNEKTAALREREARLNMAEGIAHLGSWEWMIESGEIHWTDEIYRLFGYRPQEFTPTYERFLEALHPDDRKSVTAAVNESVEKDIPYNIEHRILRPNGEIRCVHEQGEVFRDEEGKPIKMIGAVLDVTEMKEREEALKESETKFRSLVESTQTVPFSFDIKEGRYTYMGTQVEKWLGFPPETWTDLDSWANRIHPEDRKEAVDHCLISTKEGRDHVLEFRMTTADGGTVWVREVISVISGPEGPKKLTGFMFDITDSKKAEEQLREKDEIMELATSAGQLCTFRLNPQTQESMISDNWFEVLGYTPEHGAPFEFWAGQIHPDDVEWVMGRYQKIVNGGEDEFDLETRFENPSKGTIWIRLGGHVISHDKERKALETIGYMQDITDKKLAELQMLEKDEFMELATCVGQMGTIKIHQQTMEADVSNSWLDVIGVPENYKGKLYDYWKSHLHPDDAEMAIGKVEKLRNGDMEHYTLEYRFDHTTRGEIWVRGEGKVESYDPAGRPAVTLGYAQDITATKIAKELLKDSEELFRNVYNGSPSIIMVFNEDTTILDANQTAVDIFGKPKSELIGLRGGEVLNCVHEKDDERGCGFGPSCQKCPVRNTLEYTLNTREPIYESESPFELESGEERVFLTSSIPLELKGAQKALMIINDITERKKAEEALKLDEIRLESLLKLSQMADVPEEELIEHAQEEIVKLTQSKVGYLHFFHPETGTLELTRWSQTVMAKCSAELPTHYPLEKAGLWADSIRLRKPVIHNDFPSLPNKNGFPKGHFPVIHHASVPVFDGDNIVAIGGVGNKEEPYNQTDIRQLSLYLNGMWSILKRKRAETALIESEKKLRTQTNQLIQAEKMAGLGVLAAGIAHELNNPLMGILNFSQYCIKHTPEDSRAYPVLKDIEDEAQRSADIIHNMLLFSHKDIEAKKVCNPIDLSDMIGQIERLLSYRLEKDGVDLVVDIPEDAPELVMDTGKLQQVMINLITNAMDAFEGREEKKITVSLHPYHDGAKITVEDTGTGIPPEILKKIFDPFYTSKKPGEGTGMGLSISHTIISSYGGEIVCESEQGEGTKFHITLPKGEECDE